MSLVASTDAHYRALDLPGSSATRSWPLTEGVDRQMTDGVALTTFKYFAYGSNLCTRRLAARAPSAKAVATGYAEGRRLTFDKVSRDGSGKCDAHGTGVATDRVYGVVYDIALSEKAALDQAEGLGRGYGEQTVTVLTPQGPVAALTYVATNKDPAVRPYRWYKALVVAGAVEHALPDGYVEGIRAAEFIEDPNPQRRADNEALLSSNQQRGRADREP